MTSVNVNAGTNTNFALSQTRVQKILDGNLDGAREMGVMDRFKDMLNGGTKQAALNALVANFQASNSDSVSRFAELSRHLNNPSDVQMMNVGIGVRDHAGNADVHFLVKGQVIKSLTMNELSASAQAGHAGGLHANHSVMTNPAWLEAHRRDDADATKNIADTNFGKGGVHKSPAFYTGTKEVTGLLRAEDATGRRDFANEDGIRRHAEERPGLGRFISTQRSLSDVPAHLDQTKAYAVFDVYNPPVNQGELDKVLTELTPKQARSALVQTMEMLKSFYLNDVSHRDMHMHNVMIYRNDADPDQITVKAIDFGKSEFGDGVSKKKGLDDLRYMFNQTAIGAGDSVRRSVREAALAHPDLAAALPTAVGIAVTLPLGLAGGDVVTGAVSAVGPDVGAVTKHYPLHRLMAQIGEGAIPSGASAQVRSEALADRVAKSDQYKELLANVGKQLIEDLQYAENPDGNHFETREVLIERAFQRATNTLDNAADRLVNPPMPHFAIRA